MVAAFVQATSGTAAGANPNATALTTTSGNLLVVGTIDDSGVIGNGVTGITDSKGNTYTALTQQVSGSTQGKLFSIWYARNIVGGASHVLSVAFTLASASNVSWFVHEVSGCDQTAPADKVSTAATGTGTTATSGTTGTLAQADEYVFSLFNHLGASVGLTAGAGYTLAPGTGVGPTDMRGIAEYRVVAATTALAPTLTIGASREWIALTATFKGAVAAPAFSGRPRPIPTVVRM